MQPPTCCGVQPGCSDERSLLCGGRIGARLVARSTAWYLGRPAVAPPGPVLVESPVTVPSLGAGFPSGPITSGSHTYVYANAVLPPTLTARSALHTEGRATAVSS